MTYTLRLRPEAEAEIEEAFRWYQERRSGLGSDFLLCLEETLEKIEHAPFVYPVVYRSIHRALIRRFPYGIFYVVEENRVTVLAVFHSNRDPGIWKDR